MIRKLLLLAAVAAVVAIGVFWILTIPQSVPASALGPHRADRANGRTLFFIGGCSSCHMTYGQKDPSNLGGGHGARIAVRNFLSAQYLARPE